MRKIMRHVYEESPRRLKALHDLERLIKRRVCGMGTAAQGIQKQHIETIQSFHAGFRNGTEVCKVRCRSETVCRDFGVAVQHLQWLKSGAKEFQHSIQPVKRYLRPRGIGRFR